MRGREVKSKVVGCRLSPKQYDECDRLAARLDMSVSEWLRTLAMAQVMVDRVPAMTGNLDVLEAEARQIELDLAAGLAK